MAVAYEAWRAKVQVQQPIKSTTTTTAFVTKKNRDCKSCYNVLKKKEGRKKKKCPCDCKSPRSAGQSVRSPAVCTLVKNLGDDCCQCCVALLQYVGEYFKFIFSLMCLKNPHPKFCCRLCNLIRATVTVWQDSCDMIRSVIRCLLGMH